MFEILDEYINEEEFIRKTTNPHITYDELDDSFIVDLGGGSWCEVYGLGRFNKALQITMAIHQPDKEWARGFYSGRDSVLRDNRSGCCCKINEDETEIVEPCLLHKEWLDKNIEEHYNWKDEALVKPKTTGKCKIKIKNIKKLKATTLPGEFDD